MNPGAVETTKPQNVREKGLILIVDGDHVSQFYTCVILQRLGYHVISARSGEEALSIMELTTLLLVITEITLPKMNGIELLKRMKRDERTGKVPVLVYTAVKSEAQRIICREAGCAGYLLHTNDYNQIFEAVQLATEPMPRRFVRLQTWLDVIMTSPGSGDQAALVSAISEHGMFVSTQRPLSNGITALFTMHLPTSPPGLIRLQGKVMYSHSAAGSGTGMGVKFLKVQPQDSALIKSFIEEKLLKGLARAGNSGRNTEHGTDGIYQSWEVQPG